MYLAEPKNPRVERHPLWTKEELSKQLLTSKSTLTSICKAYAPSPDKWKALYFDVCRWRREDKEFDKLLEEHIKKTDSKKRKKVAGGRAKKSSDESGMDFRIRYCEELLRTKSRVKAALVTPYSADQIYMMLDEKYSEYDKDFSEMVHLTEMRMVAWAEETIWTSLDEAKNPKDKAWIAKEILKVRDRKRWGDKLDVAVNATVNHLLPEQRMKLLADLSTTQKGLFDNKERVALPAEIKESVPLDFNAPKKKEADIIEAEIVEDASDT